MAVNDIYIPLHLHTTKGSVGDSILKIKNLIKKAKSMKLTHLAVTNHGSMSDMYDFYEQAKKEDITPIIGCEIYETTDRLVQEKRKKGESLKESAYWHLVLIAKNEIGLKNLLYITTDAHLNGFYYKPRTDMSILKEHGEGIIALSACLGGKIPQMLSRIKPDMEEEEATGIYEAAALLVEEYKSIFDEFYLEIQPGDFEEQRWVNSLIVELADFTQTPLVVTNDVHYLDQEDWHAHDVHVKINRKKNIDDDYVYPDKCYYLMDYNTILNSFSYLDKDVVIKAINNTKHIASQCNVDLTAEHLNMPKFEVPEGHTEESYLAKLCFNKLNEISTTIKDPAKYVSRLMYELEVISELGFAGYFLTVRDFVLYAKNNNIPTGPGRGSVCGSLAAFLSEITQVDSIKYNLLFERFLSVHRKGSIPDIDLDFSSSKRKRMFEYAIMKYGFDKCALVSTFGMRKAKASLRDTARVFAIPAEIADEAAKLIPQVYYDEEGEKTTDLSIEDSIKIVPRLKELSEEYKEWFHMAIKLEDLPRATSVHAAGTLVSPIPLHESIPLIKSNTEGINATALNLSDAEKAKFVKLDFLSLATLEVIDKTEKDVGYVFDIVNDEYNDEATWDMIGSKYTSNLFQIGSKTYRDRMHRLKPKTIEQLAACLALVRGPCISSKMDQKYMEIVEGTREIELIHPFYDEVTAETNGALLYQEQLMQIAVNFGFTLEDSYRLMKAVAKKKIDAISSFEEEFRKLSKEKKISEDIADTIWKIMLDAGLYCFNKSHAVAYALVVYQSAFLKVHFTKEYMTNALTNAYLRKEETEITIQECRRIGIRFKPLDVNISDWEFTLEDDFIRVGMCAIKSFGDNAAEEVINNRPFSNLEDFLGRIAKNKCSKRAIVPAIFSGLFSSFNENRYEIFEEFCAIRKEEIPEEIKLQGGQKFNINDSYDTIESLLLDTPIISNPVNDFEPIGYDNIKTGKVVEIKAIVRRVKKLKDKNDNMMAFLTLETADGNIDATMFSSTYANNKKLCKKNLICDVKLKKDRENSGIILSIA